MINKMLMKRILFLIALVLTFSSANAQTKKGGITLTDSLLISIYQQLDDIDFRMHGLDRYKLYKTENIYTLLKLDTRTGQIEQLQWSLDEKDEGTFWINQTELSSDTGCGTFELYPTSNLYQFILLNKVTGKTWHVQWGMEATKRWIRGIN
jgi:hypothetical protein